MCFPFWGCLWRFLESLLKTNKNRTEEFPNFLDKIGQKIANMHNCDMDLDKKYLMFFFMFLKNLRLFRSSIEFINSSPQVFENLFLWLDNARNVTSSDPAQSALLAKFDFALIESELIQLKTRLKSLYVFFFLSPPHP